MTDTTARVGRVVVHVAWTSAIPAICRDPSIGAFVAEVMHVAGVQGHFKLLVCNPCKGSDTRKTVTFKQELDEKGGIPCTVQYGDNGTCRECSLFVIKWESESEDKHIERKQTVLRRLLARQGDSPAPQTLKQLRAQRRRAASNRSRSSQKAIHEELKQRCPAETENRAREEAVEVIAEVAEQAAHVAEDMPVGSILIPEDRAVEVLAELVAKLQQQLRYRQELDLQLRRCLMGAKRVDQLEKLPLTKSGERELATAREEAARIPEVEAERKALASSAAMQRRLQVLQAALNECRRMAK